MGQHSRLCSRLQCTLVRHPSRQMPRHTRVSHGGSECWYRLWKPFGIGHQVGDRQMGQTDRERGLDKKKSVQTQTVFDDDAAGELARGMCAGWFPKGNIH